MRTILSVAALSLLVSACIQNKSNDIPKNDPAMETSAAGNDSQYLKDIELTDVDGYFSTKRVTAPEVMLLNETDFDKHFHPAKTLDNVLTMIDFDTQRVGAIILPETKNAVTISLDSPYIEGRTLNIVYSIMQESSERSFTIAPVKVFTFDASLNIDSVAFLNGDSVVKFAVK
ncbi:putative periplasmic lipoprotein [Dysgonomonas termitidis]|uniref:Lipoprotein n=1 Tax=Dysgonomonas termitidis TaxID=1516126 RepID=A0ABV9KWL1_9BACT